MQTQFFPHNNNQKMKLLVKGLLSVALAYISISIIIALFSLQKTKQITSKSLIEELKLEIDSTTDIISISTQSACKTHQNIYTQEEIKNVFKYTNYGPCKIKSKDTIIFAKNNSLFQCEKKETIEYAFDTQAKEKYGGSTKIAPKWLKTLPNLDNKQFLFIRCSQKTVYALVFNRFNKQASKVANEIRNELGGNKKPMTVLLLVFDSISRYSFQRNLPITEKFLKDLGSNNEFDQIFSVYEFEKAAAIQARTKINMGPALYGKSWEEIAKVVGTNVKLLEKNKQTYINYQENAIWAHYSSLGYVTMFSHGTVRDDVTPVTGRYIKTDHVFTNFWKYLWSIFKWDDVQNGQKCVGNRNFHDFSFDYTYQFFDNYPENNKFAFVHINSAHEETGNVKTIDEDLFKFLNQFLKLIQNKGENLALFLMSDHGYKDIKGAQWDVRSFFEYITPFTYFVSTNEVVANLKAHNNLKHNEGQLISRYDINLSLKHLAYFPYNITLNSWYPTAKEYYTYKNTVSLFEEKVSTLRTCADIGIEKVYCLCSWYEPIENTNDEKNIEEELMKLFSDYLKASNNLKKCLPTDRILNKTTSKFALKNDIFGLDTLYKVEIETKEHSMITLDFNFCLEKRIKKTNQILKSKLNPYSYLKINQSALFLQLSEVTLASECESNFCEC